MFACQNVKRFKPTVRTRAVEKESSLKIHLKVFDVLKI